MGILLAVGVQRAETLQGRESERVVKDTGMQFMMLVVTAVEKFMYM